jgi:dienelactone hydrolase
MRKYIFLVLFFIVTFYSCDSQKNNTPNLEPKARLMKEDVVFNTTDNKKIQGTYYYNNIGINKKEPLVILVHQFMSDRGQWKSDFIDSLIARKFKVVTYDIRCHGESEKTTDDLNEILTQKGNAILDISAVFKWAKNRTGIDSNRIAVVGTSIGASLALYSKYFLGSKTAVCVSIGNSTFNEFISGTDLSMTPVMKKTNTVFLICGDKDGTYPEDAQNIYNTLLDEPRDLKYFNSDKHGKDLLLQFPEIKTLVIDWLIKYL